MKIVSMSENYYLKLKGDLHKYKERCTNLAYAFTVFALFSFMLITILVGVVTTMKSEIEKQDSTLKPDIEEVVIYNQPQSEEVKPVSLGEFTVTAYCICYDCCGKTPEHPDYGITATGTKATAGRTIAVDPNVIPYGTTVIIEETEYIAEDTGSKIKGKRIDICFDSHAEALQFGRRKMEVFVEV